MSSEFELPASWQWVRFADVARVDADLVDPRGLPKTAHIAPNHIESQTGRLLEIGTVAGDGVTSPKHRFHAGQVLYSKIRPYLAKAVVAEIDGVCSADMYPITTVLEPRFLHRWMISPAFTAHASDNQGRTLLPKINRAALDELRVPVPPFGEQRRIVAKLEELLAGSRRAKEVLDAIPRLHETLRRSTLAAAFRGDLSAEWRAKNPDVEPADRLLARIRVERRKKWEHGELARLTAKGKTPTDDRWKAKYAEPRSAERMQLPELPGGWCWASFDELAFDSLYGPRFGGDQYAADGLPTLRTTDLDDEGGVVWNAPPRVRVSDEEYRAIGLRPHDFVVTRTGATIGKCALVRPGDDQAIPSAYLIRFGLISEAVSPEYVLQAMLSPSLQDGLRGGATATAQPNINARTIAALAIPVAPKAEQVAILARLSTSLTRLKAARTTHSQAEASLHRLSGALLAKAFRGELVAQDPEDEPADVMLARIADTRGPAADRTSRVRATRGKKGAA